MAEIIFGGGMLFSALVFGVFIAYLYKFLYKWVTYSSK